MAAAGQPPQASEMLDGGLVSINLQALCRNYAHMKALSKNADTACVVKADAYGLGLDEVAPALHQAGCNSFFVAQMGEALALRALLPEVTIYVLNGLPHDQAARFAEASLRPCLISQDQIGAWQAYCQQQKSAHPAAIFIDTGFNRLGLSPTDIADISTSPDIFDGWTLSLIASHLACAEDREHPMNKAQLESFKDALAQLPEAPASLANSGGVFLGDHYLFDMTRVGIALYGGAASGASADALESVVSLHAPLLQTRQLSLGESIGYGATFTAPHEMHIGIVGAGYGDGLSRNFGDMIGPPSHVHINGQRAAILGRISMDSLAIDLTDMQDQPAIGCAVEIFGDHHKLDTMAASAKTISYELLTSLGSRYKRKWTR